MAQIHFEYRRSAATEGWTNLVGGSLIVLVLVAVQVLLVWPADKVMFLVMLAFDGFVGALIVCVSNVDLTSEEDFLFRVTDSAIECESPSIWRGTSFRISIDEIARIEEGDAEDGGQVWWVIDRKNARYLIDRNYSLPSREVIEAIRRHHPNLVIA